MFQNSNPETIGHQERTDRVIGRRVLPETFLRWNERWGAPFGKSVAEGLTIERRLRHPDRRAFGPFAFQANNNIRTFEYAWAYHAAQVVPGMRVLEVGGGLSGLQFVLDLEGCEVVNTDPGTDGKYRWPNSQADHELLNETFETSVTLLRQPVEELNDDVGQFDRVISISVIEHVPAQTAEAMIRAMARLLKPGGLCVLTVDLFLDVWPFEERRENSMGRNIDLMALMNASGMDLAFGYRDELFGFPGFAPETIVARVDEFFEGKYHAMAQALVLRKQFR